MSAVEMTSHSDRVPMSELRRQVLRYLSPIGWLASAAVIMTAALLCTTIPVREAIFDVIHLQALVAVLSSVAATHVLMAAGIHQPRWHVGSWLIVTAVWTLALAVT